MIVNILNKALKKNQNRFVIFLSLYMHLNKRSLTFDAQYNSRSNERWVVQKSESAQSANQVAKANNLVPDYLKYASVTLTDTMHKTQQIRSEHSYYNGYSSESLYWNMHYERDIP